VQPLARNTSGEIPRSNSAMEGHSSSCI
jgi:hypothetical protein